MKTRRLIITLLLMLSVPLGMMAQFFESGTTKTGSVSSKVHEAWYTINLPEDGEAQIVVREGSNMNLNTVEIHYVVNGENKWRTQAVEDDGIASLTCSNLSKGVYKIKVTGAPRSDKMNGTFQISYAFVAPLLKTDPEPNNEWSEGSLLQDAVAQSGHLGYEYYNSTDVVDWYKIVVPADGKLTFQTKSDITLRLATLELYPMRSDGSGVDWRTQKDMDGYNKDTTVVFEVPNVSAGTYYVKMNRYNGYGSYLLTYYFTSHSEAADPEPNNEWSQALDLKSGPAITGQLGYDFHNSTDVVDWYKIVVEDEGSLTFSTSTETTLRLGQLELYPLKADGSDVVWRTQKDMDGYEKDTTVVFTVPNASPGTYYIKLNRYNGYGTYTLRYTFNANNKKADSEPANNDWKNATFIENRTTAEGRLGYDYHNSTDVVDWYKIVIEDEGALSFSTTSETTLRLSQLELYPLKADDSDVVWRAQKDMDGYEKDTTVVFTVPNASPGTYYLKLNRYNGYGGYLLKYEFTPNPHGNETLDNDTWEKAVELANGSNQPGRLGYDYLNSTNVADWYKIEVEGDGELVFSTTSDPTLRLGQLELYPLKADGSDVVWRAQKDMDGYNKDTTIVFSVPNAAAGIYYLKLNRYNGYGGYQLTYQFNKNPYYRGALDNTTSAKALMLEKGKTVYTTLGFDYHNSTNAEDWYDLGSFNKDVIDVTIVPDTTKSLILGVADWYKWDGSSYNDDGSPKLSWVKGDRIERSRITTSYQNNADGTHFFLKVPRYSGCGGYTITLGEPEEEAESKSPLLAAGTEGLRLMVGGRNSVRKGVPCYNPITISNMSDMPTVPAFLAVTYTDNITLIGFEMPGDRGTTYIPADSILIPRDGCENFALFDIPSLAPWQTYTFTMITEGTGDIAYAPFRDGELVTTDEMGRQRRIEPITTACVISFLVACAVDIAEDQLGIDDIYSKHVGEAVKLNDREQEQLRKFYGQTREQFYEQQPGVAAYTAKSVVKTACKKAINAVPVIGPAINKVGGVLDMMANIVPNLRRRLWYWIYKDLGYIKDDEVEVKDGKRAINDVVGSWDPNEMVGPAGIGDEHYIGETQTVTYTILFENKAEAGDAAYRVRVSDELDENVFDVSTVKFGETSHDGVGYNWKMKREGNKLSWDIEGIELPPNVNAPEGEGYVTFSVDLKPGLADGTKIKNKATIIFDKNFPIETNEFVNTLDVKAPVTTMANVWYDTSRNGIAVACESKDAASGVESYQLFASKNGGDYIYEGQFPRRVLYPAEVGDGVTYSFYVLATDAVGNTEVIVPKAVSFQNTLTGVEMVPADQQSLPQDGQVYSIDGRYLGTLGVGGFTMESLTKGVYLIGGKQVLVK